ncbi:type II toxin-antitoxin system RelE/ParE family toxin [Escherichia coli]|nr:type II toxin-antitoxin system RelE/ParE family toxin [Escherichia coli]
MFKTKWFAREAVSHAITDEELCRAILETEQGKADALGGGVFKKRLHQNRERAIILAKREEAIGFYTFLYAKQDMSNINSQELAGFREIAKHYAFLTKAQLTAMINTKELTEICYDCKN